MNNKDNNLTSSGTPARAESFGQPANIELEAQTRPERLRLLYEKTDQLFPGEDLASTREKIRESLNVPQWGPYHNEGMLMDSHIERILLEIKNAREGNLPVEIPEAARTLIASLVREHTELFERYTLLHDIEKGNCLRIKYVDTSIPPLQIEWADWVKMVPQETQNDPIALKKWLDENGVLSISYYHDGENARQHGNAGADLLASSSEQLRLPVHALTAIRTHEAAHLFRGINARQYSQLFGDLAPEERDFSMVCNYLDAAASFDKEGKGIFTSFIAYYHSRANYEVVEMLRAELSTDPAFNPGKLDQELQKLLKSSELIIDLEATKTAIRKRAILQK